MSDLVIIKIPCPVCGTNYEAWAHIDNVHTHDEFDFEDAPIQAIADLDENPICCQKCKSIFRLKLNFSASIILVEKGRFANAYKNRMDE